ncbi:MAG: HigA family addiction module antidote protein [Gammaproteobacteria bacterium]|nr:HigA family addiction module antidote protein [Gammaproteobacteria bacterium]
MTIMYNPLHPGEIVKDALFTDTDLTVSGAAKLLRVDRTTLSRLLNGRSGISADMAYKLSMLLGVSEEMWMNLQRDYDLWLAHKRNRTLKIKPLSKLHIKYQAISV